MTLKAIEFFSGIGAFSEAVKQSRFDIEVVQAFDQNEYANLSFEQNFALKPSSSNLDSVDLDEIYSDADIWWMSPPCTPYSRRGKGKDMEDNRAQSLKHLIGAIKKHHPTTVLLENVLGFKGSDMEGHLLRELESDGYFISTVSLCPTDFGVPMRRPRVFLMLNREAPYLMPSPSVEAKSDLLDFLQEPQQELFLDSADVERYRPVLNILPKTTGQTAICFTSGYFRCRKAAGSLIDEGDGRVRRFSPDEILALLGFEDYNLPGTIPLPNRYRLVGNSVDVRSIKFLLENLLAGKV